MSPSKGNPAPQAAGRASEAFSSAGERSEDILNFQAAPAPLAGSPDGPRRIGSWLVLGVDSVGKRAACRCADCGAVREISVEALEWVACDCARRSARFDEGSPRLPDWRPQR
jgi:hypothetical protein